MEILYFWPPAWVSIKYEATSTASQDIEKKLLYLKKQIVKIWAISLFFSRLWLNRSYMTIFHRRGLGSWHVLIFLHVLMMTRLPPATQLPFCVPLLVSLYRGHTQGDFFRTGCTYVGTWAKTPYFCLSPIPFLIPQGALRDNLLSTWGLVSARRSTDTLGSRLQQGETRPLL